jgi:ABC-2 type transport system ATP-binding protein
MTAAIEAQGLEKTYPPAVKALDGLDLSVPEGTIFALAGPNGAGKSTTVRVLCTLTVPDRGSAQVAGIDVLAEPVRVRRAIGVVSQQHGADIEATARENLTLQGEFQGLTGSVLRGRIEQMLARFDLTDAADRLVKTYSGGMQRRLDLAMGLLHRPAVLFLDEPTTGLDPEARGQLWAEIERLAREERITIVLTTHYLEEADHLASQLAIIDRGRVVVRGTPEELKSSLRGDSLELRLASAAEGAALAALEQVDGVSDVAADRATIRARARDGSAAIPVVLAALEAQGAAVASVTIARPSLDDVYLRYAGRTLSEAEAAKATNEVAA